MKPYNFTSMATLVTLAASASTIACGGDASPVVASTMSAATARTEPATSSTANAANASAASTTDGGTAADAAGWRSQVLYLVMPDRFRNGDLTNDDAGSPSCFDPSDPHLFHGGDLEGLRQNLGYVREIGATAIWVTPLVRQIAKLPNGQCGYHGYWSDPPGSPDTPIEPKLGTAADLQNLVTDMHASKMRLVLDMVVNHTGDTAELPKDQPTWFHDPKTCASLGDPLIFCPLNGHPDFAQENPAVASYLSATSALWMKTFALDGIRMDTTMYVLPSYFQSSFFPAVEAVNPGLFSVGEIFRTDSTAPFAPYLDAGFDSAFHFPLMAALDDGIGKQRSIDEVASAVADGIARLGLERALDLVLMMDNHDVPRFANVPGYGVAEDEIRRRELLALDLIFTLPGIPQLYYGDELGLYGAADPDNRHDLPSWATDDTARAASHPGEAVAGSAQIFQRVKTLTALRTNTQSFIDGAYRELWRQNGASNPNVFAFARGAGSDARIVVISNGAAASGTMHIPVPSAILASGTPLVEQLGDGAPSAPTLTNGQLIIDMPAKSAAIYRAAP